MEESFEKKTKRVFMKSQHSLKYQEYLVMARLLDANEELNGEQLQKVIEIANSNFEDFPFSRAMKMELIKLSQEMLEKNDQLGGGGAADEGDAMDTSGETGAGLVFPNTFLPLQKHRPLNKNREAHFLIHHKIYKTKK